MNTAHLLSFIWLAIGFLSGRPFVVYMRKNHGETPYHVDKEDAIFLFYMALGGLFSTFFILHWYREEQNNKKSL